MKKALFILLLSVFFIAQTGFAAITDNEDGTITDSTSSLIWTKSIGPSLNWDAATTFCSDFDTQGYSDWRLPTLAELEGLVDTTYSPPIVDPAFSLHRRGKSYWSSDVVPDDVSFGYVLRDRAYAVSFIDGTSFHASKKQHFRVRCVTEVGAFYVSWQGTYPVTFNGVTVTWQGN